LNVCKFCSYYDGETLQCDACKARDENDRLVIADAARSDELTSLRTTLAAVQAERDEARKERDLYTAGYSPDAMEIACVQDVCDTAAEIAPRNFNDDCEHDPSSRVRLLVDHIRTQDAENATLRSDLSTALAALARAKEEAGEEAAKVCERRARIWENHVDPEPGDETMRCDARADEAMECARSIRAGGGQ
jgi:hypothetical protein